ncbi:MAG: oligosaccharide flippase family protein [Clostridium sp.]|nr:oligosaccharide flippase family protein [Clostridium sp.]
MSEKNMLKSTAWLLLINVVKIIFPILLFPYLARVFSEGVYGSYTYIRSIMSFVIIIMDYGFIYSGTKQVIENNGNCSKDSKCIGNILCSKMILALIALLFCMIAFVVKKMHAQMYIFGILMFLATMIQGLIPDYFFRGKERMDVIAIRFVSIKILALIVSVAVIHDDADLIYLAIIELLSSVIALIVSYVFLHKMNVKFSFLCNTCKQKEIFVDGFPYFVSTVAPLLYGSFNTIVIGIVLTDTEVAYWGIAYNVLYAVLSMYVPIAHGIYPQMVRVKDKKLLIKIVISIMPLVILGSGILFWFSDDIMCILGGQKYVEFSYTIRLLIPTIILGMPSIIFGFSGLGVINRQRELSLSIVFSAVFHLLALMLLVCLNVFTVTSVCILRGITEGVCLLVKLWYMHRFWKLEEVYGHET